MKKIGYIFFSMNFILSCGAHNVKQTASAEPSPIIQPLPQHDHSVKPFDFTTLNDPWIIEPRTYEVTILSHLAS